MTPPFIFYTEDDGTVIVCPWVEPGEAKVGDTFWPVPAGAGFCGLGHAELAAAEKGTIDIDESGRASIRK